MLSGGRNAEDATRMLPADRTLLQHIGARLRELREAAALTQDEVGERAGFSGKYIGEIEKGKRDVPMSTLRAVVEGGLGAQLEAVFGGRASRRDRYDPPKVAFARDVEAIATVIAALPLRIRRPALALAEELQERTAPVSRAAEGRRK